MAGRNKPEVEVRGLPELRRDLKQMANGSRWVRELGKSQREIGKKVAGWSQFEARGMGGPFAHFAGSIRGAGGVSGAKVTVAPASNATFWGAKKRTGWNAGNDGRPQHPEWVGASWEVGVGGQGPYAINATIASHLRDIDDMFDEAIECVMDDANSYRTSTF